MDLLNSYNFKVAITGTARCYAHSRVNAPPPPTYIKRTEKLSTMVQNTAE